MMSARVAEHVLRPKRFGSKVLVRVDLHGVSVFGPGDARALIRWEWIDAIEVDRGVVVRSSSETVAIPAGAFGMEPGQLAGKLEEGRSIALRPGVISELAGD